MPAETWSLLLRKNGVWLDLNLGDQLTVSATEGWGDSSMFGGQQGELGTVKNRIAYAHRGLDHM